MWKISAACYNNIDLIQTQLNNPVLQPEINILSNIADG